MSTRGRESQSHPYGSSVGQLIDQFATLPGIGRKSAERLAHYILSIPEPKARQISDAIMAVKQSVKPCSVCYNLTENELCSICADGRRDKKLVCIVEQPRDVVSLEATSSFQGVYHVLQGRISPLDGVGPEHLTIDALVRRVKQDGVSEIIMATNPTLEGDGTALYISNLLEKENVEITRLARGIASGSVLEFANKEMLSDALHGRQRF